MQDFALSSAPPPSVRRIALADPHQADGPHQRLRALIDANWTTQAIAVTVRLRLPDLLASGRQTVETLSSQAACHRPSLHRLLRALTSIGLVVEREGGSFELTDTGRLLQPDEPGSMAAWAELCGTTSWSAWGRLYECVRTGQSARRLGANGAGGFEHLVRDDAAALLFNRAMANLSRPVAASVAAEVEFSGVQRVVDVGGGFGELIAAILADHPGVKGVLFDMEHAIGRAHDSLAAAGVSDRCDLVAGDFFESVPRGADTYLLKSVLHDWNDAQCTAILQACARAMALNSRLLIIERLMPEHFADSAHDRGVARGDLNMLVAQDGRERTLEQYRTLLQAAGVRLNESVSLSSGFKVLIATH